MTYAIYYNGPVMLLHLILISLMFRTALRKPSITCWERFCSFACLGAVLLMATYVETVIDRARVPLRTEYGTIGATKGVADGYTAAIAFMKEKSVQHESVLGIPEDTALYFLSGTECPTRVFAFPPGVVAPGHMTEELLGELERTRPRYLQWSNRSYPEYDAPSFGVDFDRALGDYFRSHYQAVRPAQVFGWGDWQATIWERKSGGPEQ